MNIDPRDKDPRDDNTTREYERLVDQMYGREVDERSREWPTDDEDE